MAVRAEDELERAFLRFMLGQTAPLHHLPAPVIALHFLLGTDRIEMSLQFMMLQSSATAFRTADYSVLAFRTHVPSQIFSKHLLATLCMAAAHALVATLRPVWLQPRPHHHALTPLRHIRTRDRQVVHQPSDRNIRRILQIPTITNGAMVATSRQTSLTE